MSLIDWSDPEEMLGLLIEYVADENGAAEGDVNRVLFLRRLSRDLETIGAQNLETPRRIAMALVEIHEAQSRDYANDPVMIHIQDCIDELRRIEQSH